MTSAGSTQQGESSESSATAAPVEDEEKKPKLAATLIGALWFPALFFTGFLTCYVLSFHAPTPHHVRVAVASPQAAAELSRALGKSAPGAFDIVPVADEAAARQAVLHRDAVGAFVTGSGGSTLYLAKAEGQALEQVLTATFTKVTASSGMPLTTVDLVPTARGDATGVGLFYLCMCLNIVPYVTVMVLTRVVTMGRVAKLLTFVGVGAVASVVAYFYAIGLHLVPNRPIAILYGFLMTQAIAWVTYGLVPFVRQFIPGVAVALFVMLSLPSSGGAIPYQMVPAFFRALNPVFPLGNLVDALRSIFYFHGHGLLRPTLVLIAWFVGGVLLVLLGALRQRAVARRAALAEGEAMADEAIEDPSVEAPAARPVKAGDRGAFGEGGPAVGGRVRDSDGAPVSGVLVTVLAPGGRQLVRTRTDHEGRYGATGLPDDRMTVVILAPGFAPAATRVLLTEGHPVRQDFVLVASDDARTSRPVVHTTNGAAPA